VQNNKSTNRIYHGECVIFIIIIVLLGAVLLYLLFKDQVNIWRWQHSLKLKQHQTILNTLTAHHNGFVLSKQARLAGDAPEYVYGEIDFMSFIALLSLTKPNASTVFYDLGSGTGKTVLASAMVFPIKKSCGIELFTELHRAAEAQRQALLQLPSYSTTAQRIHFLNANFLDTDLWSVNMSSSTQYPPTPQGVNRETTCRRTLADATLIFINATGYFGETWDILNGHLDTLVHCRTIITTSKQLSSKQYKIHKMTQVKMSWGIVKAYIHNRACHP